MEMASFQTYYKLLTCLCSKSILEVRIYSEIDLDLEEKLLKKLGVFFRKIFHKLY